MQPAAEPFPDLVAESLDEAAFLWGRWEAELSSLTRNLDEVWSWTEDRLQGALVGVRVAGAGLAEIAGPGLRSTERHRVAACAGLLASSPEPAAMEALTAAIADADDDGLEPLIRGLELLGSRQALKNAAAVLSSGGLAQRAALTRLKTFHRAPLRDDLDAAFASGSPAWQAYALQGLRPASADRLDHWIARGTESDAASVRHAAVEAGIRHGVASAWRAVTGLASVLDVTAAPYLTHLAIFGTPAEHDMVYGALRVPTLQAHAVRALGHIGTARAVECSIAGMRHPHLARLSGEAYCWITGADLVRDSLAQHEPAVVPPAFEDDDLDANLVPTAQDLWPLPDVDAVRKDWEGRRQTFASDVRHVLGRPVTTASLLRAVEAGPMLRRPDVILELSARSKGVYDVEPLAFTERQRHMMTASRAALSTGAR